MKVRRSFKVTVAVAGGVTRFTRVSTRKIGREIAMLWIEFPNAKRIEVSIGGAR